MFKGGEGVEGVGREQGDPRLARPGRLKILEGIGGETGGEIKFENFFSSRVSPSPEEAL